MELFGQLFSVVCILLAAMSLGNWFLAELRKHKHKRHPWYRIYFTLPGVLMIILIILLPVIVRIVKV